MADPAFHLDSDVDMAEYFPFMDRPGVVYQDKLISDAMLTNVPIKSEHSYSLNSDGDSTTDSPHSLQAKIEGKHMRAPSPPSRCKSISYFCCSFTFIIGLRYLPFTLSLSLFFFFLFSESRSQISMIATILR